MWLCKYDKMLIASITKCVDWNISQNYIWHLTGEVLEVEISVFAFLWSQFTRWTSDQIISFASIYVLTRLTHCSGSDGSKLAKKPTHKESHTTYRLTTYRIATYRQTTYRQTKKDKSHTGKPPTEKDNFCIAQLLGLAGKIYHRHFSGKGQSRHINPFRSWGL